MNTFGTEPVDRLASAQPHFEEAQYLDNLAATQLQSELDFHVANLQPASKSSMAPRTRVTVPQSDTTQRLWTRQFALRDEGINPARAFMIASAEMGTSVESLSTKTPFDFELDIPTIRTQMDTSVKSRKKKTEFDYNEDFIPLDDGDDSGNEFHAYPLRSSRYGDTEGRRAAQDGSL